MVQRAKTGTVSFELLIMVAHRVRANSERCGYTPTSSKMSSQGGGVGAFSLCIVLPLN